MDNQNRRAAPSAASIEGLTPEQVALQKTFAERLYGSGPDIDQRRDALYTMALIFAAAETDSAREATFEDMFKEFCAVPRLAIFDSLTRHTGAEIAANYTFETEEFFEVEAVERLLATQSAKQGAQPSAWISVDEREPEDDSQVIILYWPYNNHENPQVAGQAHYYDGCFWAEDWNPHHPPSHWMPLPETPTMKSKRAASTDGEAKPSDLQSVVKFLMGEAPLEGVNFGEKHPTKAGAFWWRLNLRAALHAASKE